MALLGWLFGGNDRELAKTYDGPSATERANGKAAQRTAKNLLGHRNGGAARAAREGQAWEDSGRSFGGRR